MEGRADVGQPASALGFAGDDRVRPVHSQLRSLLRSAIGLSLDGLSLSDFMEAPTQHSPSLRRVIVNTRFFPAVLQDAVDSATL